MKVKVNSGEFKKALENVRPIATEKIHGLGAIGLLFSGDTLHIKAFSGFWIEIRIECSGITDETFVAISSASVKPMALYLDSQETEILILADKIQIKSGEFKTLQDKTNEQMSPSVDFDNAEWTLLPMQQIREMISVSLVDSPREALSVLYVSDFISCLDGFVMSTYRPDWDFDGFAPIPKGCIDAIVGISDDDDEVSLSLTDRLITLSVGEKYITTPYPECYPKDGIPGCEFHSDDSLIPISGGLGKVSELILRELEVCAFQGPGSYFTMWTEDEESGLHYESSRSEFGQNSGVVWSDLENFQARCSAIYLRSMIKKDQMWDMHSVLFSEDQRSEEQVTGNILIELESGVRHLLAPIHMPFEELNEIRSNHDTTE